MPRKPSLPGRDELERLYFDEGLDQETIGERYGVTQSAVSHAFKRHGLTGRHESETHRVEWASFGMTSAGYEKWSAHYRGDSEGVYVHRLLAVAEFGFDAVADSVVHHRNHIPWDNRPDNIALFDSQSEHSRYHAANVAPEEPVP